MSITTVNIDEAGSRINERVKLANQGQVVVITDEWRPTARLVSVPFDNGKREFGKYRGKIKIAEYFDAAMPDEFWLGGQVWSYLSIRTRSEDILEDMQRFEDRRSSR